MGGRGAYFSGKSKNYDLREFDTVSFARNGMIKVLKKRDGVKNLHFPIYSNTPNTTYFVLDERDNKRISAIGIYRNNRIVESIDLTDTRGIHWHDWSTSYDKKGREFQLKSISDDFNLKNTHKRFLKYAKEWES